MPGQFIILRTFLPCGTYVSFWREIPMTVVFFRCDLVTPFYVRNLDHQLYGRSTMFSSCVAFKSPRITPLAGRAASQPMIDCELTCTCIVTSSSGRQQSKQVITMIFLKEGLVVFAEDKLEFKVLNVIKSNVSIKSGRSKNSRKVIYVVTSLYLLIMPGSSKLYFYPEFRSFAHVTHFETNIRETRADFKETWCHLIKGFLNNKWFCSK